LKIKNNSASQGGGFYIHSSNTMIINCEILNNTANVDGGGFIIGGNSEIEISFCLIDGNNASGGSGIAIEGSEVNFNKVTIVKNEATHHGGGIYLCHSARPAESIYEHKLVIKLNNKFELSHFGRKTPFFI